MTTSNDFSISKSAFLKVLRPEEKESLRNFFRDQPDDSPVYLSDFVEACAEFHGQIAVRIAGAILPEKFRLHLCGELLALLSLDPMVTQGRQILADHMGGVSPGYGFDRVKVAYVDAVESALKSSPEARRSEGTAWMLTPAQHGLRAAQAALEGDLNLCAHGVARALAGGKNVHLTPGDWRPVVDVVRAWMDGPPPTFGVYQEPPPRRIPSPDQVAAVQAEIRKRKLEALSIEELTELLSDDDRLSRI